MTDISLDEGHLGELEPGPGKEIRNAGKQDLFSQGSGVDDYSETGLGQAEEQGEKSPPIAAAVGSGVKAC